MKQVFFDFMTNQKVLAATDLFARIQKAAQDFQNNLNIIAPIIFVVSAGIGALMFVGGRKGAENGKSHIWNILMGVVVFVGAASLIATLFTLFGGKAQGI